MTEFFSNPAFEFMFWGFILLGVIALVMTPPKWLEDRIDRSAAEYEARKRLRRGL